MRRARSLWTSAGTTHLKQQLEKDGPVHVGCSALGGQRLTRLQKQPRLLLRRRKVLTHPPAQALHDVATMLSQVLFAHEKYLAQRPHLVHLQQLFVLGLTVWLGHCATLSVSAKALVQRIRTRLQHQSVSVCDFSAMFGASRQHR